MNLPFPDIAMHCKSSECPCNLKIIGEVAFWAKLRVDISKINAVAICFIACLINVQFYAKFGQKPR
jgi:hypothetical protein